MTVLIDLNQILITPLLYEKEVLNEYLILNLNVNALRKAIKPLKNFGEIILCSDSKTYWRTKAFPYYKAHRKSARDKSQLDWKVIFNCINKFKEDLQEYFPYKFIEVTEAEADDIIGVLTKYFIQKDSNDSIVIVSSDSDFKQLHRFPQVKQYNPLLETFIKIDDPKLFLKEKIIRGDSGDGIPSILSSDNTFVIKQRQSPITKKKLAEWLSGDIKEVLTEEQYKNWQRNNLLINFENIPKNLQEKIIETYEQIKLSGKNRLYEYLLTKNLPLQFECINDFLVNRY